MTDESKVKKFLCPKCGAENSAEVEKCVGCGIDFKRARELAELLEVGGALLHPKAEKKDSWSWVDSLLGKPKR